MTKLLTIMSNTQQDNKLSKAILDLINNCIIPVLKFENTSGNAVNNTLDEQQFSYVQQRAMINQIFATASGNNYNIQSIMLRLIVIDSLYSTNAAYSYFSFEEMANAIKGLGNEEDAAKYFDSIATGGNDDKCLFSKKYGIRKNLKDGSKQMSLMSKYAYYVLLQNPSDYPLGFPIYDSLAIKMYPKVCNKVGIEPQKITESTSIKKYIELLNTLRKKIFSNTDLFNKYQQYDLLDAYLWRMGKLDEGNYSLLFNKDDYEKFITNIGLSAKNVENYGKHISNVINNAHLVECKEKKEKNGNIKYEYKYDFNKLVRYQCLKIEVDDILKDVTNKENMAAMINHWKILYTNTQQQAADLQQFVK